MKLLDLFCGAGGCSVGYARAGFDVVGVDIEPHDDYPFELHVMDWEASRPMWDDFDVIHASPPCPRYSVATPRAARQGHPDLVAPVRQALAQWGGAYVIENVPGAPLESPALLCGRAVGVPLVRRHRLFEANWPIMSPGCACGSQVAVGVYGHIDYQAATRTRPDGSNRGRRAAGVKEAQAVLGIDWMTRWGDLADAIPPAYTEHIGRQLIDYLGAVAA